MIIQISTLVIKYWLRINSRIYEDRLTKLQVLKLIKPDVEFESYLTQVKNVKQAVTRFIISADKLPIETGRYTNIERNLRLCSICKLKEIGDEYQYFSNGGNEKLKKLRKQFLKELIDINCNFSPLGSNELFLNYVSMNEFISNNLLLLLLLLLLYNMKYYLYIVG